MLAQPGLPGHVLAVLRCRRDVSRSSTAKLTTIRNRVGPDARVGAGSSIMGRTARADGRAEACNGRTSPEARSRTCMARWTSSTTAPTSRPWMALFEDFRPWVSWQHVHITIEAAPGCLLVACDQHRSRRASWSGWPGRMMSPTCFAGARMCTWTANALGSKDRQLGKTCVVGCGFGMGPVRFRATARGYGVDLTETEAEDAVAGWRQLNHRVVTLWWETHKIAMSVAGAVPGAAVSFRGGMTFRRTRESLHIVLPERTGAGLPGRPCDASPGAWPPRVKSTGASEQGRQAWLRSWPGRTIENIVQAIARDASWPEASRTMPPRGPPLMRRGAPTNSYPSSRRACPGRRDPAHAGDEPDAEMGARPAGRRCAATVGATLPQRAA